MLGGGQLAKYALVAANTMGYTTAVLDPDPAAPAAVLTNEHLVAAYDDPDALGRLAATCAAVTTEFENPPASSMERLAQTIRVAPSAASVSIAQDRVAEKAFLTEAGFPVGPHAVLEPSNDAGGGRDIAGPAERAEILESLASAGAIIKTARLGYDGKGQRRVQTADELWQAWEDLGQAVCVVESQLDLVCELSVIVGRTAQGVTSTWPLAQNTHVDGILDLSLVPAPVDPELSDEAVTLAVAVADALDYVGVLAVELFVVSTGEFGEQADLGLLVNELAPRPHNSGHWTLDASVTSQFEQQIRAVCGLALGDTAMTAPSVAMVNLLGDLWFEDPASVDEGTEPRTPDWTPALDDPSASLHLYGKAAPRVGRKMGHLTVTGPTSDDAAARALALRSALSNRNSAR